MHLRHGEAGVLLLHQCNRDRSSWNGLASDLAGKGFHVLTLDYRGYGDSGGTPYTKLTLPELREVGKKWPGDVDVAFANLVQKRIQGLLISPDSLFLTRLRQIVTLTTRHAVPTVYPSRFWAEAGGLMSYGSSFSELPRQVGIYTGRVLKGEKPGDIPILRATKFELVINLVTAKAFGLAVPPTLLATADEVIE